MVGLGDPSGWAKHGKARAWTTSAAQADPLKKRLYLKISGVPLLKDSVAGQSLGVPPDASSSGRSLLATHLIGIKFGFANSCLKGILVLL